MKNFLQFIIEGNSKAQEGEGDILWHISRTTSNIKSFKPLTHFGTIHAARDMGTVNKSVGPNGEPDRKGHNRSITAVRIKHGKSLEAEDGAHDNEYLLHDMHKKGILSHDELQHHIKKFKTHKTGDQERQHIADVVRSKGYQSIHYTNTNEDPGSTSHVITHPDQVRILRQRKNKKDLYLNTNKATVDYS